MGNYTYSGSAKKEVLYHYICEHCGKEVSRSYMLEVNATNCESEFQAQSCIEHDMKEKVNNFMKSCDEGNFPFVDECPYCHKHQSWKVKESKIYPIIGLIAGLIPGFIITWLFGIWHYWFVAPIVGALIGVSIGLSSYLKIKKETANVKNKQKPTYTIL